jgi:hypothetical protein
MKALLPDSTPGTYFMAAFLLRLPHRSNAQPAGPQLAVADSRSTPTWGTIRRRLSFGLRTFFVTFLLAAVYRPILGLDFLSAHGLLVDPVGRQVLDSKTLKPLSQPSTAAGTRRSKFAAALCSIAQSVLSLLASVPATPAAVRAAHYAARATHITVTTTQVRRRPRLHSTVGTVLVGLGPGRPRCGPGRPRCGPGRPRCGPGRPRYGPGRPAAVRAAHYAAMATHTTVTAAHIEDKTAHDPASATNTHDNGHPHRSGYRRRRTIAHRSYGFRSRLVHTRLARYIKVTTT